MAVYIPFVFLSSWVIGRFELRTAMLIGAFLNAIGALVRYLGADHFIVLMLGQVWCNTGFNVGFGDSRGSLLVYLCIIANILRIFVDGEVTENDYTTSQRSEL